MLLMKMKVLSFFDDVLIKIKQVLRFIASGIIEIILMALLTIYGIIYKLFSIAVGITNIGFVVGIVLLVLNIMEFNKNDIGFTATKYFDEMLFLFAIHIAVYFVYKLLSIKADIID